MIAITTSSSMSVKPRRGRESTGCPRSAPAGARPRPEAAGRKTTGGRVCIGEPRCVNAVRERLPQQRQQDGGHRLSLCKIRAPAAASIAAVASRVPVRECTGGTAGHAGRVGRGDRDTSEVAGRLDACGGRVASNRSDPFRERLPLALGSRGALGWHGVHEPAAPFDESGSRIGRARSSGVITPAKARKGP